jgi:Na+-transporting methylmalonyl-CoA/oxaloacetate decarboxylase gamma subunit
MPVYCKPPEKQEPEEVEPEKPPEPEPDRRLMPAVAAAVRWHRADLAELMRESDAMVRAMTTRRMD